MMLHRLIAFARNRRGNVASTFALVLLPLLAFLGVAVDYARLGSASTRLQLAADMAALAGAKMPASTTQAELESRTKKIVADFMGDAISPASLTVTPNRTTGTVRVEAAGRVATPLASLIGIQNAAVTAQSTVTWGNTRLRVALALDVTGSMASDGKMTAMKAAAQNLLKQLKAAANADGDVYVSIIPFAKSVNVGASNYTQSWVKWSGSSDTWDENNGTCAKPPSCSYNPYNLECYRTYRTKSTCQSAGRTWTASAHSTWNGCVMDRDQNADVANTAPTSWATNFPAEQYDECPAALMGLTYDWTALGNKITSLQPGGGTNQVIGLAWAFQSLTAPPLTVPPKDDRYQYSDVIILLSDGLNTQNRFYGNGSDPSPQVDARQRLLCDNVKAANITLYTVQVNTDRDPTSTLLQSCASDSSKFFLLTSADQIITTFSQIGTDLSRLRVSQ